MTHEDIVEACARVLARVAAEGIGAVAGCEVHPAANVLPLLSVGDLADLASSIQDRGYLRSYPVVYRGDNVLVDGRNRVLACVALGHDPADVSSEPFPTFEYAELEDESDTIAFVRAATTRRELDIQTRTEVLAELYRLESEAVKAAGRRKGAATPKGQGVGRGRGEERTAQAVAAETGESARTVRRRLAAAEVPEVRDALRKGEIEPGPAAEIAAMPADARAAALADPEFRKAAIAADKAARAERRDARRAKEAAAARAAAEASPVPHGIDLRCADIAEVLAEGPHGAVLVHADPPWPAYDSTGDAGAGAQGAVYATLTFDEIGRHLRAAFDGAAPGARLALWTTGPNLLIAAGLAIDAGWGYKSAGLWVKTGGMGVGHHWRGDGEVLLLLTKGAPPSAVEAVSNAHVSPRAEHSAKPGAWLEDLIRSWVPEGGRVLDMYAGRGGCAAATRRAGGRSYLGAEISPDRHAIASATVALEATPVVDTGASEIAADASVAAALAPPAPEPEPAPEPAAPPPGGYLIHEAREAFGWEGSIRDFAAHLVSLGFERNEGPPRRWVPPAGWAPPARV